MNVAATGLVTLTSDFGLRDVFVGVMKGIMLGINPQARLFDLTHEVPPQNIAVGSFLLAQAAPQWPPGTVHLAVVDPGVGGQRLPLAMMADGHFYVGPDNGLFSGVLDVAQNWQAVCLAEPRFFRAEISQTFHGRDVFAPVAAHLSLGQPLYTLGPALSRPQRLAPAAPTTDDQGTLHGEVIHVDHFGNLITNIAARPLSRRSGPLIIHCAGRHIVGLSPAYTAVAAGELLATVDSFGLLELAVNCGSAATVLAAGAGTAVTVTEEAG